MKLKFKILLSTVAVSAWSLTALAQNTATPITDPSIHPNGSLTRAPRPEPIHDAVKTSDIIGMEVQNNQNEKLGKVDDLALDVESGRIVQVILSTGGFLGMGSTLTALPPRSLHHDVANKNLHLDISKEKLTAAPKFDPAKWDEGTQSNRLTEVYGYYGEQPYFVANVESGWATNKDGTIDTDRTRTMNKKYRAELARNAVGIATNDVLAPENRVKSLWSNLGYIQKASQLIGLPIKNLQDENLGKVENFIVDLSAGRIVAVIISSGGFIGIGDELSAVPPTAFVFNADHNTLQLNATKDLLANSPHFKANEWPDLSQPDYASGVYHAYKVEPYFAADATMDADNTGRNIRDRDSQTLTPLDQGNSVADVGTSAQIRKEIIANKSMSLNAKNVKIITHNGQVTLRGPVDTSEEKRIIGEIADRIAHSENVDNQLEVRLTTTSL